MKYDLLFHPFKGQIAGTAERSKPWMNEDPNKPEAT